MKKFFVSIFAALLSMSAFAGSPTTVKNYNSSVAYGTENVLLVYKEPNGRCGTAYCTTVLLRNGSELFVSDTSAYKAYTDTVAGLFKPVAVPGSVLPSGVPAGSSGLVYDVAKASETKCPYSNSLVSWPFITNPHSMADGCAFQTAVINATP